MKRTLSLLFSLGYFICSFSQQIEIYTNGYFLKFKKIDTLFYSEYPLTSPVKTDEKRNDFNNVDLKYSFGTITKTKPNNSKILPSFTTNFYVYEDGTLEAPTSQLFLKPSNARIFIENYSNLGKIEEHSVLKGFYYLYITDKKYLSGEGVFALCNELYMRKAVSMVEPVFTKLIEADNPFYPWEWNINNTGIVPGGIAGAGHAS